MKVKKALGWLCEKIIKYRIAVVVCVLIACIFAAYGVTLSTVNSDVLSYLPKGTDTYNGGEFLYEHFLLNSNAVLAIDGEQITYKELEDIIERISQIDGVSSVLWLGSFDSITLKTSYGNLKIESDIFSLIEGGEESRAKLEALFNRGGNYLVMVSMTVGASTQQAGVILNKIDDFLQSTDYVSGGTAPISRQVYDDAITELPIYIVLAAVLVLILLFLVNSSYLEPIIFVVTMGVAILVNMGTNFLFGEVSIITFCASSILQLAVTMDYAIFLTHMYNEEKTKGSLPNLAIRSALSKTFGTILSSALTTMGGFAAFFVMSFTLGADLGGVLLKGIALSLVTVVIVQPCLLLIFNKPIEKSRHRVLHLEFKRLTRFSIKYRTVIVIVFAALLIPAFIGQYFLPLSYLNFLPESEGSAPLTSYVEDTGNQFFLALPINSENQSEHLQFVAELEELDVVNSVTGLYAFLPQQAFDENGKLVIKIGGYSMAVDAASAGGSLGLVSRGYTLYMVALDSGLGVETQEAVDALNRVLLIADSHFDGYYVTGMTQAVKDFKVLTPRDFLWITVLSILIIFAVLIFTFKNVKYPILLVLLIELGIWINLSISTVFGQSLNFVSYIIIGAIQLGATVDYAILVSTKYLRKLKEGRDSLTAAYESSVSSSMSVLTSASIMVVACVSVALITSNAVIKEITFLVTRGAVISASLVLFVLPALLACSSKLDIIAKEAGGVRALTRRFLSDISGQFKKFVGAINAREEISAENSQTIEESPVVIESKADNAAANTADTQESEGDGR